MTWEHIAVLAAAVVVIAAAAEMVAWWHRRRILADAAKPDPDGWSMAMRGWDYREKYELILAGVDPTPLDSPIYDEMGGDRVLAGHRPQLAIESGRPRELEGAAS